MQKEAPEIGLNVDRAKARPKLKVLFITGYAANAALRGEFLAPGMELITKPFSIDELRQKIKEILSASSMPDIPVENED